MTCALALVDSPSLVPVCGELDPDLCYDRAFEYEPCGYSPRETKRRTHEAMMTLKRLYPPVRLVTDAPFFTLIPKVRP